MDYLEEYAVIFTFTRIFRLKLSVTSSLATNMTTGRSLFPPKSNPCKPLFQSEIFNHIHLPLMTDARALVRLQSDHINRSLVPAFHRYLQAQEASAQIEAGLEFHSAIEGLVHLFEQAEQQNEVTALGLWLEGNELGWADVMAGPCRCIRLKYSKGS